MQDLELLKKVPLFSNLGPRELMAIKDTANVIKLPKQNILFCEGDKGDALYLILKGKVKAFLLAEDGREVVLSVLSQGEIVGEMAIFDLEEKRSATVETLEDSEFLTITGNKFIKVLETNPQISLSVLKTLSARLRETSSRIRSLIFLDTYSRVGRYLLDKAKTEGRELADGSVLVTRPTHEDIAGYIGTSRETVSRSLKELENQGLLRNIGRKVILYKIRKT
jgi:CRP/FNR family transcriptional regulator, cyclic AMP receptor protein